MHTRNLQREAYVFTEHQKGRTYKDIGQELGITKERVRQVYVHACREKRKQYFKTHPGAFEEWLESPNEEKCKFIPEE